MPSLKNRHGLSRRIPAGVSREVRQRCGFGCVVCGLAIYQYEHVHPPFADARTHDPTKIVLLCGGCHDRVNHGLLAKETVIRAGESPRAFSDGFSFGPFDLGSTVPAVQLGEMTARNSKVLLRVEGQDLLGVLPPEDVGGPFRINATFHDSTGKPVVTIKNNEWRSSTATWDVEVVGPRIVIREQAYKRCLVLRAEPPDMLCVERMKMAYAGYKLRCDGPSVKITTPDNKVLETHCQSIDGCDVALSVSSEEFVFGEGCGQISPIDFMT